MKDGVDILLLAAAAAADANRLHASGTPDWWTVYNTRIVELYKESQDRKSVTTRLDVMVELSKRANPAYPDEVTVDTDALARYIVDECTNCLAEYDQYCQDGRHMSVVFKEYLGLTS